MVLYTSDYGSGSSTSSQSPWPSRESISNEPQLERGLLDPKSSSYNDMARRRQHALDDVMLEFRMNGFDSPYNPDEDGLWRRQQHTAMSLTGLGPSPAYLRQKSWPEPERSPAQRLPRPRSLHEPRWSPDEMHFATSTPILDDEPPPPFVPDVPLTAAQARVLHTLPDSVLYALLRGMRADRRNKIPQECRFCKNNGEQQSFYRSHSLKDGAGRVSCPVLRAFTCRRCGARGDFAHTIKYCPYSTNEERIQSAGMMRSVRMASGRRRHMLAPSAAEVSDYVVFGAPTPSVVDDSNTLNTCEELDPVWAALEQKLSLY